MHMMQTRRRFLTTLSLAGAAGFVHASPIAGRGGAPRKRPRSGSTEDPWHLHRPAICRRGAVARRGFYRCPLRGCRSARRRRIASGAVDFGLNFASVLVAGRSIAAIELTVLGGVHVGCFEFFVNEGSRSLTDLKGKRVGIAVLGSPGHLFLAAMAAHVGHRPGQGYALGHQRTRRADGTLHRREGRRVPGVPARPAGPARPAYRPRHRQQRARPALVAIFLLHAGGQPGVRP